MDRENSPRMGIPWLTIITAAVIVSAFPLITAQDSSGTALIIGTVITGALFSFDLIIANTPWIYFTALASYFTAFAVCGNPVNSMLAAMSLPVGFALSLAVRKKFDRTQSVICVSAVIFLFYIVYLAAAVYFNYGGLSAEILEKFYSDEVTPLREMYLNLKVTVDNEQLYLFTENDVDTALKNILTLMPSIIIVMSNVIAFLITSVLKFLLKIFRIEKVILPCLEDSVWELNLSIVSAYVFCGSYILSILCSAASMNMLTVVTSNILIILIPGFSLIGMRSIINRIKKRSGVGFSIMIMVFVFMLLFVNITSFFTLSAFFGVIEVIISHHRISFNKSNE